MLHRSLSVLALGSILVATGQAQQATPPGLLTTAEVLAKIDAVDGADGVKDGKITVDILRAILGVPRPAPQAEVVPKHVPRRIR